jgi:hypothetical protein
MRTSLFLLSFWYILLLCSCSKEELSNNDPIPDDTILSIVYNPYYPIDTNDLWIYKDTYSRYESCFDGEELTQCLVKDIQIDTFRFYDEKILGNYKVRLRNNLAKSKSKRYFNTQSDRIILVMDGTYYLDSVQVITILFTDVLDTSWTVAVLDGSVVESIRFTQKHPENSIDGLLELMVSNGEEVGLLQEYKFLRGKGIISYSGYGGSSQLDGYLSEYIDN